MSIWDYMPGFVARPLIRGIKAVRHTNDHRREKLLRRDNVRLEGMLVEARKGKGTANDELINQIRKNAILETQVMEAQETAVWTEEALTKERRAFANVKKAYQRHNAAILTGNGDYLTQELKDCIDVNEGLESLAKSTLEENVSLSEENREVKQDNFRYRVSVAIKDNKLERFLAFVYIGGHVYNTPKFDKYCKSKRKVEIALGEDKDLKIALEAGLEFEKSYDGGKFVFLARKKKDDVAVAYVVPDERPSRVKLFIKAGVDAAKTLRKSLRGDYDFGGIGFA